MDTEKVPFPVNPSYHISRRDSARKDRRRVTLLYAARDPVHNHAAVLLRWLAARARRSTPPS